MLYTPFKNLRLSVRQRFVFTLSGEYFLPIFFKLGIRGDIWKECIGIADGKGTELWPFIDVRNWFLLSIFGIRSVLGLQMDTFRQIITELWSLIDVQNWVLLNIFLSLKGLNGIF